MKTVLAEILPAWRDLYRLPFSWLSRVFSQSTVTLNIEGNSIRFLTTEGRQVTGWGSVPLGPGLVKDGLIVAPQQVGSLIKTLLAEKESSGKRVIASLAGMRSVPRLFSLPEIAPSLRQEAIRHEAEREMPVPLDELYLCWRDLGRNGPERRFFVVGVPRLLLDAQVQALAHADIKAHLLDLKPMALARAVGREEAVIIDLERETSDLVLVVEGVPVIMRTLIMQGGGVTLDDQVKQVTAEVSRTLEFYNSSHPERPIDSATPAFLTGELAEDDALADLVRAGISNPVEELAPDFDYPAELPIAEYAVNIGLALKGPAPIGTRRAATFPALDLAIVPDSHRARRPQMKSWLYALSALFAVALLLPAYQAKSNGEVEAARLEMELGTISQQLQDTRQILDPVNGMEIEVSRLREERDALLGTAGSFTDRLDLVFGGLTAEVGLNSITVTGNAITLDGFAITPSFAIQYASFLEETELFSAVHIASLTMASGGDSDVATFIIIIVDK